VLGFEPMTHVSESECATHYTTAPQERTGHDPVIHQGSVLGPLLFSLYVSLIVSLFRFRYQSFTECW